MFTLNVFKHKKQNILEKIVEAIDLSNLKSLSSIPTRYINGKELVIDYRPHENHYQTISIRNMTHDYILIRNWRISNNKRETTIVSNSLLELKTYKEIKKFVMMILENFERKKRKR